MRGESRYCYQRIAKSLPRPPYFAGDGHLFIPILRWREPQIEMVTSQDSNIKNIDDDRQSRRGTPPAKMSGWFWSGQTNSVADQGKRL